jgi:hypothetical protein
VNWEMKACSLVVITLISRMTDRGSEHLPHPSVCHQ